jgi:hypothetical protein
LAGMRLAAARAAMAPAASAKLRRVIGRMQAVYCNAILALQY